MTRQKPKVFPASNWLAFAEFFHLIFPAVPDLAICPRRNLSRQNVHPYMTQFNKKQREKVQRHMLSITSKCDMIGAEGVGRVLFKALKAIKLRSKLLEGAARWIT